MKKFRKTFKEQCQRQGRVYDKKYHESPPILFAQGIHREVIISSRLIESDMLLERRKTWMALM